MISSSSGRLVIAKIAEPVAQAFARAGITPDVVTLVGTAGVVGGALGFLPRGKFWIGVLVITAFVFSDIVDGALARLVGRSGPWGAWLDSSLDRVGDAAIFGSLVWWYDGRGGSRLIAGVALFCLISGSITSYVKARAEGLGLSASTGLAERAERLVLTLVAAFFDDALGWHWLLPSALWILAVLSLVTIAQRSAMVWRQAHPHALAKAAARGGAGSNAAAGAP